MQYQANALGWPEVVIHTDVGPVDVVFTNGSHAAATANSGERGNAGDVTYRNKHWNVFVHLWKSDDWGENAAPGESEWDGTPRDFTEVNSLEVMSMNRKTAAPTFRAAIVAAIVTAVRAYVEANPEILVQAERNRLKSEMDKAKEKTRAAYAVYVKENNAAVELEVRLRDFNRAHAPA